MKRKLLFVICALAILLSFLCGCSKYRQVNIIGKTAEQTEEQYGKFDVANVSFVSLDSSYYGCGYGYILKESRVGFLGTTPAEYFFIVFDENNVAIACYKGFLCNGG